MKQSSTIEIDLEVYKLIESARESFDQSENDILRGLLNLSPKKLHTGITSGDQGLGVGSGVFLPDGTILKKRYKGKVCEVEVENGKIWINGRGYTSASGAAVAITGSAVNGWRFWEVKRPEDNNFRLLADLRK